MKIQVTGEVGRECNPFDKKHQIELEPSLWNINPKWRNFEQSVQSFPAPGIEDGEHEAEIWWQYLGNEYGSDIWYDVTDYEMAHATYDDFVTNYKEVGMSTRQIWKLTPKAK